MKIAELRVCASCEWVYKLSETEDGGCPKCGFAHYGAHWVYGKPAYRYAITQEPWLKRKLARYEYQLQCEIVEWNNKK